MIQVNTNKGARAKSKSVAAGIMAFCITDICRTKIGESLTSKGQFKEWFVIILAILSFCLPLMDWNSLPV